MADIKVRFAGNFEYLGVDDVDVAGVVVNSLNLASPALWFDELVVEPQDETLVRASGVLCFDREELRRPGSAAEECDTVATTALETLIRALAVQDEIGIDGELDGVLLGAQGEEIDERREIPYTGGEGDEWTRYPAVDEVVCCVNCGRSVLGRHALLSDGIYFYANCTFTCFNQTARLKRLRRPGRAGN